MKQNSISFTATTRSSSLSLLRIFCALQVYFIHYFAGHGMRSEAWIFNLAVPTFLLMSAYLYGLRRKEDGVLRVDFLKKRFISLSSILYPFVLIVFIVFTFLNPENMGQYAISLIVNLLYSCNIYEPLPHCGHLWFMQSLAMCYLAMYLCSKNRLCEKMRMNTWGGVIVILIISLVCGYVYRGNYLPYIVSYVLVYYNAKAIRTFMQQRSFLFCISLLIVHYIVSATHYNEIFHYGIYLYYFETCLFSLVGIALFEKLFSNMKYNKIIDYMAAITMEFYLCHHFFAYDYSILQGLAITVALAILLHFAAVRVKVWMNAATA